MCAGRRVRVLDTRARPEAARPLLRGRRRLLRRAHLRPGSAWFDDDVGPSDDPTYAGGVLDLTEPRNPFRGWSWVFIPSCTGDVHVGDRRVRYGSVVVEQRGWQNAHAALRWAFAHFPRVETVLVAGCSAGSVGSAFHVPAVIARWPRARVTQLGDSLAFVFHRPVNLTEWGAHKHFPSFFQIGERRFTMVEYLSKLARHTLRARSPASTMRRTASSKRSTARWAATRPASSPGCAPPRRR